MPLGTDFQGNKLRVTRTPLHTIRLFFRPVATGKPATRYAKVELRNVLTAWVRLSHIYDMACNRRATRQWV